MGSTTTCQFSKGIFLLIIRGKATASNPNPSGHDTEGGSRPGQTHKKPRDLSTYDREECGHGEGVGVYTVCM